MSQWKMLAYGVFLWCGVQPVIWADQIELAGGRILEGVVVRETSGEVEVQVTWRGSVTLSRSAIRSITRGTPQERDRLLAHWRETFQQDQQRERERLAFADAQRAKGLIKYHGTWLTREEMAVRQAQQEAERAEEARQQREEEIRQLAQRVQALEADNQQLQHQLAVRERLIFTRPLVLKHCDPVLFRDEQGNLVKVRTHGGHRAVVTTDGTHLDLQAHGDHLVVP